MTDDDHVLARDLARQAGLRLLELRAGGGEPDLLRKSGDRQSHEFLMAALAGARPGDVVLSEEGADSPARLSADRVWIVDPLDGTREFGEAGRADWAVHVALWERTERERTGPPRGQLIAGAVALPALDQVLSTAQPPQRGPDESAVGPIRVVVSRTRPPQFVQAISGLLDIELVPLGSAGAKVAAVVRGEADAYIHGGGFYEWDTAAPVAVAHAAGFHASRIDGSELAYNQPDLLMPDILVCRPSLAGPLLQAIREVTNAD
jgi:3'(2'), 5'-bisphosphate nucleotidase